MKNKYALLFLLSLLLLTGCGDRVSNTVHEPSASSASDAVTSSSVTKSTVTTTKKATTTAATTTKKPEPPEDLILSAPAALEVYDEVKLSEFITDSNVDILDGDTLIDTSETGQAEVTVKYKHNNNIFEKKLTYNVVDTTPPVLLNSGWDPYHKTGTYFDLNEYVGFADNYDRNPILTYEGTVDPNTPGTYPLSVTATDSSGNQTSWETSIIVVDQLPVNTDNPERYPFEQFVSDCGGEGRRLGIDVSTWQGSIDFNAVRDAGCEFVMIRIGYYYDHIVMDDCFKANLAGARAAGLDVGIYFYTTDNTEEGVREHAAWIAEQLNGEPLDLPVAFDWEEFGNFQQYGMSIHDLNSLYGIFAEEMERYGYKTMLYSSKNFLNNFWSENTKDSTPVWLAHFVNETDYEGNYAMWQKSALGRIPGIAGDVDLDVLYTDMPLN